MKIQSGSSQPVRVFRPTSCLWVDEAGAKVVAFTVYSVKVLFFYFSIHLRCGNKVTTKCFLFTYVCNQHTYNNFFHFITVKRSRSPDSWSTMLVLLCSGERQFLAAPWVKYCRLSQAPKYHFFSALVPALKLHSIFLQDNGPCHTSRSSTAFYICVMQPLLLWVHFFFITKKKTAHKRHSVSYELSSECIRELHFQKKSVVIVSSSCFVTALSDGHQAGS